MRIRVLLALAALAFLTAAGTAQRTDSFSAPFDHPAISYSSAPTTDAIAQLNKKVADGSLKLTFDPETGYLKSVLDALKISTDSQSVVFSQTSFQAPIINMDNPRALYFNDSTAVGWVRGSTLLEVAALDPRQGVIFYGLDQHQADKPQFERSNECLICHDSSTHGVPGLMVLTTFPRPDEQAYAGGFAMDQRTPYGERYSGWYVTGDLGTRHLGNIAVSPEELKRPPVGVPGQPLMSLDGVFDRHGYLTPYSDVVALMVLTHQATMTNLIIRLGWETRIADPRPISQQRIRDAADDVVDYMLFADEPELVRPVKGSSNFTASFAAQGPKDSQGRSLRQFDLQHRLLKYPCSYMIYSDAFDALPAAAKAAVYAGLRRVLTGAERGERFRQLSPADRRAILEILTETKPDFAATATAATSAPRTPQP